MQIRYTLSEKDLWESLRAQLGWWARFQPFFGGLLILSGVYTLAQNATQFRLAIAGILLGVFLGFGIRMAVWFGFRRDKRLHDQFVATLSEDGIELSSSVASTKFVWGGFTKQVETKNLFLLFQGPGRVNIFPKRSFCVDEGDTFRALVQQKLNGGQKMNRKGLRPVTWIFIAIVSVAFVLMVMTIRNTLRQAPSQPAQTQSTN